MASRNATAPKLPSLQRARDLWARADEADWHAAVSELSRERGGASRIQGPHVIIACPWHDDARPSCYVTPSRGLVKCYACSTYAVEPMRLVTTLRRCSYVEAAKWLRKRLGLRGVLTDELADRLDKEAAEAALRDAVVGLCCDQLKRALAIGLDDAALTAAELYWARPAVAWLFDRYGQDEPGHEPLWPLACDDQLVGVLPPLAIAGAHFGPNSDEFRAFSGYFERELAEGSAHVGWLVFPRHDISGHVASVKLRCPSDDLKDFRVIKSDDETTWPGLYGLRRARRWIGGTFEAQYFTRAHVMEGETSALATLAHQIRRGTDDSLGWIVLGGSGGSTPTLEPLADLGIERVSIVQDHDDGGDDVARHIIEQTRTPKLALEVFDWPQTFDLGTDPRDAVAQVGYPEWSGLLIDPDRFTSLPRWLSDSATTEVTASRIPPDDVKRRGDIATEWGKLATHPQEVIAYATMTAAILGIDAGALRRAIESRDVLSAAQDHATLARYVLRDLATEAEVRFCEGSFWRYTDGLWRSMDDAAIERAIIDMCKDSLKLKASDVHGVRKLAASLASAPGFFDDARPGVMLANGFLSIDDAGTVALERPSPEHRARIALPIDYNPDTTAPRWRRFLLECLAPVRRDWTECVSWYLPSWSPTWSQSQEHELYDWLDEVGNVAPTIRLLQEFVGVCLFGLATRLKDPRAIVLEGSGANGKSVFLDVIKELFPQSWSAIEPQAWDHPYNRHALVGKRINLVSELPSREVMSSAHVKQVITGDPTSARDPYKAVVNFRPIAGHLLLANELPSVADSSHGYWRRQIVISWPHRFEGDTAEAGLADRIVRAELAGVVAWAVQGATRLLQRDRKYIVPDASELAVAEWKRDSDPVAMWLETATRRPETERDGESLSVLFQAFRGWAQMRGYHELSEITFARRLKAAGLRSEHKRHGNRWPVQLQPPTAGMEEARG